MTRALSPGTDYTYEVIATTSTASSPASSSTDTTTFPDKLSGLTAAADSSSQVTLGWTPVTGATGYEIDRQDSSGNWEIYDAVDDGSATGYTDTDVQDGTTYTYRVLPYNDSGTSDDGSAPTAAATTPLIAPANVNVVALSPTSIEVVWDDQSSSETGFEVQRSGNGGSTYTDLGSTAAGVTDYVDSTALPQTTYYYRVEATNTAAGPSTPGSVPELTTTPAAVPVLTDNPQLTAAALTSNFRGKVF